WGGIGLVISTPLTACLAVLGRYVRDLQFFSILLGDEPVLEPHVGYYQRLLARDPDEAVDIIEGLIETHSAEEVYERVRVPAMVLARENRERGESTAEEQQFILEVTRELLDEFPAKLDKTGEEVTQTTNRSSDNRVFVFGCPARDETDELALIMFGKLLDSTR